MQLVSQPIHKSDVCYDNGMSPKLIQRVSILVILTDTLALVAAIGLSWYWRHTIFDPGIWAMTMIPIILIGTGIAVWEAVKEMKGS